MSGESIFSRCLTQLLPANAAQASNGSSSEMAKCKRTRIVPGEKDRERLERIGTNPHTILGHVQRADIVLQLGDGLTRSQKLRATDMSKSTVWRCWDRFLAEGVVCLLRDLPGRSGRKPLSEEKAGEAIEIAKLRPGHCSHWTRGRWRRDWGSRSRMCSASCSATARSRTGSGHLWARDRSLS